MARARQHAIHLSIDSTAAGWTVAVGAGRVDACATTLATAAPPVLFLLPCKIGAAGRRLLAGLDVAGGDPVWPQDAAVVVALGIG